MYTIIRIVSLLCTYLAIYLIHGGNDSFLERSIITMACLVWGVTSYIDGVRKHVQDR